MEENMNEIPQRPVRRQRRKRSKMQIFKEAYLPVIIAGAAALLVIIFIIGSITRGVQERKLAKEAAIAASESEALRIAELEAEVDRLLEEADYLAKGYDIDGAIAVLDSFSGDPAEFTDISNQRSIYLEMKNEMVAWNDLSRIPNLSFNMLVADPARAYADDEYGSAYRNNFITISEFTQILQQLYDNGYVLVSIRDLVTANANTDGTVTYSPKTMYLPADKTPFILTQTGVNYNIYMVDGDGDSLPDKDGAGFASKLVMTASGQFANEMVDSDGNLSSGSYDLVPILEDFIAEHPDFSVRGARAILAVSGYNGVFGYRIHSGAKDLFGEDAYNTDRLGALSISEALRATGYEIACYSYNQSSYSYGNLESIQEDQRKWNSEIASVIGATDIMVFFKVSDIGDTTVYSGEKYDLLQSSGYRIYIGANESNTGWGQLTNDYVRQNRILVTGSALESNPEQFAGLFDAASVLDPARS